MKTYTPILCVVKSVLAAVCVVISQLCAPEPLPDQLDRSRIQLIADQVERWQAEWQDQLQLRASVLL